MKMCTASAGHHARRDFSVSNELVSYDHVHIARGLPWAVRPVARAMADGAEDDDKAVREARQLPLPERLAHAHWRVRADAYADVGKESSTATDATSPTLSEFGAARSGAPARPCV